MNVNPSFFTKIVVATVAMLVVTCRLDAKKSSIGQSATGGTEIQLPALLEL